MTAKAEGKVARILRGAARVLPPCACLAVLAWGFGALWFQRPGPAWGALLALWCVAGVGAALALAAPRRLRAWRFAPWLFAASFAGMLLWWSGLRPSHQRQWADDVARLPVPELSGERLVLHNVRNFEWRTEQDYVPRWETRSYDLGKLQSADLVMSYWMGPHIAHTLVSFGFSDGQRLVFSLEIRKERGEEFSALGGFFRKYEQVLVAADERDIIRTRSNARGEDVYLYALRIPPAKLRPLLLGYLQRARALQARPEFYNTLSSNCTTIVYELARRIAPRLPLDYRLLASGHFAEYVHEHGGLAPGLDYASLQRAGHINARALGSDASGEDFSTAIRRGIPVAAPGGGDNTEAGE